jgi:hypothetical protein
MNKYFSKKLNRGFTLVEIMVVIAIFAILGSLMLDTSFSSRKRINALSLDNDSIALEIRDMQNRTLSFIDNGNNNIGYGIYFDLTNPNTVRTFYKYSNQDFNSIEIPTSTSDNPTDDLIFSLSGKINKICLNGVLTNCDSDLSFKKLALFFIKPKQYANFYISNDGSSFYNKTKNDINGAPITQACIELATGQSDEYRHIDIFYVGQISTSAGPCK